MSIEKRFNLPAYINIPLFLYKNEKLDRSSLLLAGFLYSLHSSGKRIKVSNAYLAAMTSIKQRQLFYDLELLEKLGYIERKGKTTNRIITWIYQPESQITIVEELDTSAIQCTKLVQSSALDLCNPVHLYNKVNNKEDNTTSSSSNFFEPYQEKEKEHAQQVNDEYQQQQLKQKFRNEALSDNECQDVYTNRFTGLSVTLTALYDECVDYWSQKNQMVYKSRFLTHLKKTPLDKYKDFKDIKTKSSITPDERELIQIYCSSLKTKQEPEFKIQEEIKTLKSRLRNTDTAIAREALANIEKSEEYACSSQFKQIVKKSITKKNASEAALNALSSLKKDLK